VINFIRAFSDAIASIDLIVEVLRRGLIVEASLLYILRIQPLTKKTRVRPLDPSH
jgi:hypothetical protein